MEDIYRDRLQCFNTSYFDWLLRHGIKSTRLRGRFSAVLSYAAFTDLLPLMESTLVGKSTILHADDTLEVERCFSPIAVPLGKY